MTDYNDWVSLGEAASILGVHPSTVRHWADSGDLPSQRTPGGHRRFKRSDLEQWHEVSGGSNAVDAQLVLQNALGRARLEVMSGQLREQPWYNAMDDTARRSLGQMGRQLLELLAEFLTHEEEAHTELLNTISQLGKTYATLSVEQNITLVQTMQAFIFFRDMMTDSVIQMAEVLSLRTPSDWGQRLQQVNHLTDQMLLALVETYEEQIRT